MNTAVTKSKMGNHSGVSYCIQITKAHERYYPRIVILSEPPLIIDAAIIFYMACFFRVHRDSVPFNTNPFKLVSDWAVSYIDAILDPIGKARFESGAMHSECGVQFLEKKLSEKIAILKEYKKIRRQLMPVTEDYKIDVFNAANHKKFIEHLIKIHYESERYAGRKSTDN
jgi:hypothetical protein